MPRTIALGLVRGALEDSICEARLLDGCSTSAEFARGVRHRTLERLGYSDDSLPAEDAAATAEDGPACDNAALGDSMSTLVRELVVPDVLRRMAGPPARYGVALELRLVGCLPVDVLVASKTRLHPYPVAVFVSDLCYRLGRRLAAAD